MSCGVTQTLNVHVHAFIKYDHTSTVSTVWRCDVRLLPRNDALLLLMVFHDRSRVSILVLT